MKPYTVARLIEDLRTFEPETDILLMRDYLTSTVRKAQYRSGRQNDVLIRYRPRARTVGTETWNCPVCSEVNKHKLSRLAFKVDCAECGRVWALGRIFCSIMGGGEPKIPSDMFVRMGQLVDVAPDYPLPILPEALPLAELGTWRSGEYIHRLRKVDGAEVEAVRLAKRVTF